MAEIFMRCLQPLWWGYGAPGGHCGEPDYGPEKLMRDSDDYWKSPQLARCPLHGGPTVEEFSVWLQQHLFGESHD